MKKTLWTIGTLLGLFFIARAIAWPFSIDTTDPASYANAWGGPTLSGAVAVHCGPGIVFALLLLGVVVRGRLSAERRSGTGSNGTPSGSSD